MERQIAQLLESRVRAADAVEQRDVWLKRVALIQSALEIARAQLVLLRVEVFLTARGNWLVLVELEAGVHAPQRTQRCSQGGADSKS